MGASVWVTKRPTLASPQETEPNAGLTLWECQGRGELQAVPEAGSLRMSTPQGPPAERSIQSAGWHPDYIVWSRCHLPPPWAVTTVPSPCP